MEVSNLCERLDKDIFEAGVRHYTLAVFQKVKYPYDAFLTVRRMIPHRLKNDYVSSCAFLVADKSVVVSNNRQAQEGCCTY